MKNTEKYGDSELNEGGIGIRNVEKRLLLMYPKCHSIQYSENEGIFRLEINIELG